MTSSLITNTNNHKKIQIQKKEEKETSCGLPEIYQADPSPKHFSLLRSHTNTPGI
jgi:hypothetical protein